MHLPIPASRNTADGDAGSSYVGKHGERRIGYEPIYLYHVCFSCCCMPGVLPGGMERCNKAGSSCPCRGDVEELYALGSQPKPRLSLKRVRHMLEQPTMSRETHGAYDI